MKTQLTNNKERKISTILAKWLSNYITAMSKALYPPEVKGVESKNDRHRIFDK
ncbi:hypothetical protein [Aquimarina atlantica]|uniref:hypothetical protein n=1 Tax=Aquimarina atlantica TaxID=1317122 RepID=UPI000AA2FF3F|nr:hypothetical protein [Aquimarina atlantica]